MKNVLSDSQKYQLAKWLESNKDAGLTRTSACGLATHELLFNVTYSNMQSAEKTTGISLVKVPEVKINEDISTLAECLIYVMHELNVSDQKLLSKIYRLCNLSGIAEFEHKVQCIKPSPAKPFICHKHG